VCTFKSVLTNNTLIQLVNKLFHLYCSRITSLRKHLGWVVKVHMLNESTVLSARWEQ